MNTPATSSSQLFTQVRALIAAARQRVASSINSELTLLYWHIGRRIHTEILQGQKAEYGKQVIAGLAQQLTQEFGRGWSERQLRYCLRFAELVPEIEKLQTVCAELTWSHLKLALALDDALQRDFYIELAKLENWSVRQLQERIQSMLFERTAISKKPDATIHQELQQLREQGQFSVDLTFRDPYVLDFLGLADTYSERYLENAILAEPQ